MSKRAYADITRFKFKRWALPGVIIPVTETKIWLKHFNQWLFLQPMLSATIFKSIFEFRIWIPNLQSSQKWICFVINEQMAFLKIFVSHQLYCFSFQNIWMQCWMWRIVSLVKQIFGSWVPNYGKILTSGALIAYHKTCIGVFELSFQHWKWHTRISKTNNCFTQPSSKNCHMVLCAIGEGQNI